MNDLSSINPMQIHGTVDPRFSTVATVFAENFRRDEPYRDQGAAVAVYLEGRCVVDLWAGWADRARTRPWQRDTLVNVFSATKGVVALAAALQVEEGRLGFTEKVARYWPEFAAAGKQDILVEDVLAHRAGLQGFASRMTLEDLYDWKKCCAALAAQEPVKKPFWWPAGWWERSLSYHAISWGYLVGEIMRRASADDERQRKTVGQDVQERLAGPLKADFFIGLPAARADSVADVLAPTETRFGAGWIEKPLAALSSAYEALANPTLAHEDANGAGWRSAEIPAANGHASAQGLARIYAGLHSELDGGGSLNLSGPVRKAFMTPWDAYTDRFSDETGTRAGGLSVIARNGDGYPATMGHMGWSGCLGCANSDAGLGFGYVTNQAGKDVGKDPRGMDLLREVCAVVGVKCESALSPATHRW